MGSQGGAVEEPKSQPLPRQGSLYSLTLDEVQTHLGNLEKPLGSMNLDELLKNVSSVEANQSLGTAIDNVASALPRQGSFALPTDISKKTVDDIWKEIQQNKTGNSNHERNDRQPTLGEMTLEDLLLKAGVVTETIPSDSSGLGQNMAQHGQLIQYHQLPTMPQVFMPYQVSEMQATVSPSSLMGALSDTQAPGRKRVASGDIAEKTVERRQKRMIKNRESAARSRARKQAYTHELEIKVSRLEEENERLRRQKEVEKVIPSAPPPDPKRQLRRTSSAPF